MRVLRRFPVLADPLREGRLCLSTLALLGPVLTEENLGEVVEQATFMTKAQVERLVAALAPRTAPKEGLRKLPARGEAPPLARQTAEGAPLLRPGAGIEARRALHASDLDSTPMPVAAAPTATVARPTVRPVDANTYSLRVTVDEAFKVELERLKNLLAHKVPNGDLAAVLREAVQCAIEKHAKRKGAVPPSRKRKSPEAPMRSAPPTERGRRPPISAEVRREVWKRDGGRCAWQSPDGRPCGSTWKLELDHIRPVALGGLSTVENLRLACRSHNVLSAEQAFGREFMERMRAAPPPTASSTSPRES